MRFIWFCGIMICLSNYLNALIIQTIIIVLLIFTLIAGIVMKRWMARLRPPLDRANLTIKTFLDSIPALKQIRPVYRTRIKRTFQPVESEEGNVK